MKKIVSHITEFVRNANLNLLRGTQANILQENDLFQEIVPTGDLLGCLDSPTINEININGTLIVFGWLSSRNSRIESLLLAIDNLPEETITYDLPRPDVAQVFPDLPNAALSGFRWNILLGPNYAGNLTLTIWAVLENGEKTCCFTRRVTVKTSIPTQIKRLNPYTFIYGAALKAIAAYQHGRLSPSPVVWVRKLRRYYQQIQADPNVELENFHVTHPWQMQDPYQRWIETNRLTPKLLTRMAEDAEKLKNNNPKISIIVPVYNTSELFLTEMIDSVTSQIYPNWELCLADDASSKPHVKSILEQAQASDSRIKVNFRPQNGHIVEATNSALDLATGEYVAFLDHDDILSPDALLHIAECITKNPDIDWIYTDEDKIDLTGRRYDPQMKGKWSPEMMLTHNFTQHFTAIRKTLVDKVGRMRKGYEGAQDLDLFLRVSEHTTPDKVKHIPKVCYHWRCHAESTASHGTQKRYIFDSADRGITDALARRGLKAKPFLPDIAEKHGLCLYQLKWDESLLAQNPVTIAIPTRDKVELLEKCVASLERTVDKRYVKLLIIDDGSREQKTHEYFKKLVQNQVLQCRVINSGRTNGSFNYARLMNLAASYVDTPYMLHLNNDIEAIAPGWLEDMVGWMSIDGVEIVGARLFYPDRTIQHAGVVIGPHNGLADHLFHHLPKEEVGYICLPHAARNVSAVTGACLLTSTALYREIGGFDEENFAVQYNDVDYCLRVMQLGKRIVYTPQASLIHLTSASRGNDHNYQEHLNFLAKYKDFKDPFFNESLDIDSMWMAVNPYHYCHTERASKLKVLVLTHNLNLEGATLIVYNYARHFATVGNYQVNVLSPEDGLLREAYENLNIPVKIVSKQVPFPNETIEQFRSRLKELGDRIDLASFDLVVCNTLISFWGVELARLFGLPTIWHIHESATLDKSIKNFFGEACEESMPRLLKDCFLNTNQVVFQAKATQNVFQSLNVKDNFRTIPGAVPIDKINHFRQSYSKSELRAKYGINENDVVLTVVGTICERKGQHIFIEAIKELEAQYSERNFNLSCAIVGGRVISYYNFLQHQIRKYKLENMYIYDQTTDVYDFFAFSDIFVCSSFEESFPRVILEAMAFELKIVSTNVFGIPEMISDRYEAYLVEPGNSKALADAIQNCLENPEVSARMASNAYAKVSRMFDEADLLRRQLLLTKQVALK
ncbi:glycosyltransferase [Argonema antarcticum]|uniref:glycosyltransferase n=1 Tax=Argonema antarcticum TaxID=2942763 RepID=UPI002012F8F6|nr:glycosyltransferase [Argonema antarcticum]MCL1472499.1 glycosyltransferase [Argonema antarcticum A004/B2]